MAYSGQGQPAWPYNLAGRGDKKTLIRAVWQGTTSKIRMHPDVQSEDSNGVVEDNYDDAEGWAPRINYGDVPANFSGSLGSNIGGAPNPTIVTHPGSWGSMQALRTKNYHSVNSSTSYYGRKVLHIENHEGSTSNEVYTNNYSGPNHKAVAYMTADVGQIWYAEVWVREVSSGGYHRPNVTMWLFGTKLVYLPGDPTPFQYKYNFSGHTVAEGGDYDSPSEASSHYRKQQLNSNGGWTKLQMCCKFNQSVQRLSMRLDIDDGHAIYDIKTRWDRMQLYPIGMGLGSDITGTNPDGMNEINYGTYAT